MRNLREAGDGKEDWDVFIIGLGACLVLLTASLCWLHYYCLAIPALLWCFRTTDTENARWREIRSIVALGGAIALAAFPYLLLFPGLEPSYIAWHVSLGTLTLLTLLIRDLLRVGRRTSAS